MTADGKGEDRAEGFAGAGVATSPEHPSQSSPDHIKDGDRTRSNRSLTGADRPAGGKPDPDRPKLEDRYKP
ncbi:hypothetical protein [Methylobacterium iners]|uniref:Uncharacterized protein n=1 Tax=Methylobacterium iners TaxID=418707 RepID=A0ABQ4S0Q5_9HYPH|nr:hypothetical protein [Methylobacterium iners]GJD96695.1 hypothetical protein OCOJLMKI_3919 [Methylobacterium iners]